MSEDSSFLVHELQATHKQKTEMKKQLDDTKRERDHLTQCLSILQSDHPSLFEVRRASIVVVVFGDNTSQYTQFFVLRNGNRALGKFSTLCLRFARFVPL